MKSLFISFFMIIFFCACNQTAINQVYPRDKQLSKSVYKMNIKEIIDIRKIKEIVNDENIEIPDFASQGYTATAWVIKKENNLSYIMTAGHVCETNKFYSGENFGPMPIVSVDYTIEDSNGKKYTAYVVADDDKIDLCILYVSANLEQELTLSTKDPDYGQIIKYIGAPLGIWGGGITPIFSGLFSGRGKIWGGNSEESLTLTTTAAPGVSGCPVFYNGKVIGVFTAVGSSFNNIGTAVPWNVVANFKKQYLGE